MSSGDPAPIPNHRDDRPLTLCVTGANGFVGSNLCRHLLVAGHRVRGLVRPSADRRFITDLTQLEIHGGDLADTGALTRAFTGVEVVFHVAARTADWGVWALFEETNIRGVANVMAAALAAGVRRVVHFSSVSVYGFPGEADVTEDRCGIERPRDPYIRSKQQGETIARAAHGLNLEVVVLRPGGLYGPNDHVTSAPLFTALERHQIPYVDGGRHLLAPAYIDNLIQASWLAAARPDAAGRVYNITDDGRTTWREYLDWSCAELGCAPPRWSLPVKVAWSLACLCEDGARLLRLAGPPPLTRYRVRAVMADSHYSSARAKQELGYAPAVSTREGLRRTVAWYRRTAL